MASVVVDIPFYLESHVSIVAATSYPCVRSCNLLTVTPKPPPNPGKPPCLVCVTPTAFLMAPNTSVLSLVLGCRTFLPCRAFLSRIAPLLPASRPLGYFIFTTSRPCFNLSQTLQPLIFFRLFHPSNLVVIHMNACNNCTLSVPAPLASLPK